MAKTKLNKKTQAVIVKALKNCLTIKDACDLAGITKSTFFHWMEQGEAGKKPYKDFSDTIKRAEPETKEALVGDIRKDKHWTSKAWILERRWPNDWGRKDRLGVSDAGEHEFEW